MLLGGQVEPLLGDEKMPESKYPICGWRPCSFNSQLVQKIRPCGQDGEAVQHGIKPEHSKYAHKEPKFGTYIWTGNSQIHVTNDYEEVLEALNGPDLFVEFNEVVWIKDKPQAKEV